VVVNQLHAALSTTVFYYMLACGLWGIFSAFRGGLSGSLAGALVIGEGVIIVQGLLGGLSYLLGSRAAEGGLHYLYGLSALITLPGLYGYTRGRPPATQALWFGGGALFIAGLAIRGMTTGGGL
jgi:heme A synthase